MIFFQSEWGIRDYYVAESGLNETKTVIVMKAFSQEFITQSKCFEEEAV